ncbi:MAG: hypothetical protein RSA99_03075 [Oscillospiraceae bacterium]
MLIALSGFLPKNNKSVKTVQTNNIKSSEQEYLLNLTKQIEEMVEKIDGVGNANVTITMKNGSEQVFAKDEIGNIDSNEEEKKEEYQQKTIIVDDKNGQKTALISKTLEPTVNGVCVVCDGGNNFDIQQKVIYSVKTALNIGTNKVYVTH